MDKKDQTVATYDQSAEAMKRKFNSFGARSSDLALFFEFIENKNNPAIVEIGCGNGREAAEILKTTKNYVGVDISKGMLALAKDAVPNAKFELADIDTYNFPENVDGIVSFASLLHSDSENLKNIFVRADSKLVKNGIFYISLKKGEYNPDGDVKTDEFGERTFYFYDIEMIERLVPKSFQLIYKDEQHLRDQNWFTVVFRKIN